MLRTVSYTAVPRTVTNCWVACDLIRGQHTYTCDTSKMMCTTHCVNTAVRVSSYVLYVLLRMTALAVKLQPTHVLQAAVHAGQVMYTWYTDSTCETNCWCPSFSCTAVHVNDSYKSHVVVCFCRVPCVDRNRNLSMSARGTWCLPVIFLFFLQTRQCVRLPAVSNFDLEFWSGLLVLVHSVYHTAMKSYTSK